MTPLRVFVQYSHETPEHNDAVWQLVVDLRNAGIDARSDHNVSAPPEGWPRWMANQIETAKFVLVVCSKTNARRVAGKEKAGKGRGATFEGLLLNQIVHDKDSKNSKVIPILLATSGQSRVPAILKPFTHYRLPRDWEPVLRHLTNQPALVAPPLGQIPVLPRRGGTVASTTTTRGGTAATMSKKSPRQSSTKTSSTSLGNTTPVTDVPEKLNECLEELDQAAEDGARLDWKPVVRWYQTWRPWFVHALPGETLRIKALVDNEPPEGDIVGRGRQRFVFNSDYDNSVADLKAEVMGLIKKHVPANKRVSSRA